MKKYMLLVLVALFSLSGEAQEIKNKNAKHEVEVLGNCGMCKKRIEKAAFGVSGVRSANWDSRTQKLTLILNEEKSSLEKVEKAIAEAGHDTENAKATQADYDNLHGCCKYTRGE